LLLYPSDDVSFLERSRESFINDIEKFVSTFFVHSTPGQIIIRKIGFLLLLYYDFA